MAKLSDETQAIIDRLKKDGELTRFKSDHSIREVNIKLDKFEPLFQNIKNEMMFQTDILREQAGIAKEAAEARRRADDLAELDRRSEENNKKTSPTAAQTDRADSAKKTGGVMSALMEGGILGNLKDLFILSTGGFALYNLAKGYIDEKYDGAFSKFEDSVGKMAKDFAEGGQLKITETMQEMKTEIANLKTTLGELNNTLKEFKTTFDNMIPSAQWFKDNWDTITIGLVTSAFALKVALNELYQRFAPNSKRNLNKSFEKLMQSSDDLSKRMNEFDPAKPKTTPTTTPPTTNPKTDNPPPAKPKTTPTTTPPTTSRGIDISKSELRMDAGKLSQFTTTTTPDGKVQLRNAQGGTFASDDDALKALEKTLDPKYSKIFKGLVRAFAIVGIAFSIYDAYRLYIIFADDSMSHDMKINAGGAIVGPLVGSLGAGALGALAGSFIGPWGTLIGGAAGAIAGGFLTPEALGVAIVRAIAGEDPEQAMQDQLYRVTQGLNIAGVEYEGGMSEFLQKGGKLTKGQNRKLGRHGKVNIGGIEFTRDDLNIARTVASDQSESDIPSFMRGSRGFQDFGKGTVAVLHGREAVIPEDTPAGQLLSALFDQKFEPRISGVENIIRRVEGAAGGQGTVVINNAPTVAPTVSNVIQGGSVMQNTTLLNTAGGGSSPMLPGGVH
jgi:hypothetical protein